MQLKQIIILQNKIDLVKEEQALAQQQDIKRFVEGTVAENAPIIPISAQLKYNLDLVAEYICTKIPVPPRDFTSPARMIVIRSFDVNKPGAEVKDLLGGVAGQISLRTAAINLNALQGARFCMVCFARVKISKFALVSSARVLMVRRCPTLALLISICTGKPCCQPIVAQIVSLCAEQNELEYAVPGGLIGVGTKIDPTLTRTDRLVGQVNCLYVHFGRLD